MLYKTIDIVKNLILDTVVLLLLSPDNNNLTIEYSEKHGFIMVLTL